MTEILSSMLLTSSLVTSNINLPPFFALITTVADYWFTAVFLRPAIVIWIYQSTSPKPWLLLATLRQGCLTAFTKLACSCFQNYAITFFTSSDPTILRLMYSSIVYLLAFFSSKSDITRMQFSTKVLKVSAGVTFGLNKLEYKNSISMWSGTASLFADATCAISLSYFMLASPFKKAKKNLRSKSEAAVKSI